MRLITVPPPVILKKDGGGNIVSPKTTTFYEYLELLLDQVPDWGQGYNNHVRAGKLYDKIEKLKEEKPPVVQLEDYEYEKLNHVAENNKWGTPVGAAFRPFTLAMREAQEEKGPAKK